MELFDFIALGIFLLVLVAGGLFRAFRVRDESSYLLADRGTGLFALTATLVMTEFNTTTLIAFSSVGYFAGWWGLSMPFIFLTGLTFYALTVAKKWKRFNAFSIAELFTRRYGPDVGRITSIALLLSMIGFSATYVKSLNFIFAPLFPGLSSWELSGLITGIVLLITLRGGLVAVIQTDVISFLTVLVVLPLILFFAASSAGPDSFARLVEKFPLENSMKALPGPFVFSLIILTMFCYISAAWYGQKIFAARSERVAYLSVLMAAVLVFILYGAAVIAVAMLAVKGVSPGKDPQASLPYIVSKMLPGGLRGLAYGVFFATGATTLAGVWSAMSTMVVGDFLSRNGNGTRDNRTRDESAGGGFDFHRGLYISLAFALTSYVLANTLVDNVLNKMILANVPVAALAFALLAGFYWKGATRGGAYVSMIVGLAGASGAFIYFGDKGMYTWYWAVYVMPLIFVSGWLGSRLLPAKPDEAARRDEFYRAMNQERSDGEA